MGRKQSGRTAKFNGPIRHLKRRVSFIKKDTAIVKLRFAGTALRRVARRIDIRLNQKFEDHEWRIQRLEHLAGLKK